MRQSRRTLLKKPEIRIPQLVSVKSSNISKIGLCPFTGRVFVEYKNTQLYYFEGLTEDQYFDILNSDSVGKALHATGKKSMKVEPETKSPS